MLHNGQKITVEGQIYRSSYNGELATNINFSDIFTELIQAAGMGCEYYASDMFYNLTEIHKAIQSLDNKIFYIGIRDYGVDGNGFVKSRLENSSIYGTDNYIKLYRCEVKTDETSQTVELLRTSEYDVRKELKIK